MNRSPPLPLVVLLLMGSCWLIQGSVAAPRSYSSPGPSAGSGKTHYGENKRHYNGGSGAGDDHGYSMEMMLRTVLSDMYGGHMELTQRQQVNSSYILYSGEEESEEYSSEEESYESSEESSDESSEESSEESDEDYDDEDYEDEEENEEEEIEVERVGRENEENEDEIQENEEEQGDEEEKEQNAFFSISRTRYSSKLGKEARRNGEREDEEKKSMGNDDNERKGGETVKMSDTDKVSLGRAFFSIKTNNFNTDSSPSKVRIVSDTNRNIRTKNERNSCRRTKERNNRNRQNQQEKQIKPRNRPTASARTQVIGNKNDGYGHFTIRTSSTSSRSTKHGGNRVTTKSEDSGRKVLSNARSKNDGQSHFSTSSTTDKQNVARISKTKTRSSRLGNRKVTKPVARVEQSDDKYAGYSHFMENSPQRTDNERKVKFDTNSDRESIKEEVRESQNMMDHFKIPSHDLNSDEEIHQIRKDNKEQDDTNLENDNQFVITEIRNIVNGRYETQDTEHKNQADSEASAELKPSAVHVTERGDIITTTFDQVEKKQVIDDDRFVRLLSSSLDLSNAFNELRKVVTPNINPVQVDITSSTGGTEQVIGDSGLNFNQQGFTDIDLTSNIPEAVTPTFVPSPVVISIDESINFDQNGFDYEFNDNTETGNVPMPEEFDINRDYYYDTNFDSSIGTTSTGTSETAGEDSTLQTDVLSAFMNSLTKKKDSTFPVDTTSSSLPTFGSTTGLEATPVDDSSLGLNVGVDLNTNGQSVGLDGIHNIQSESSTINDFTFSSNGNEAIKIKENPISVGLLDTTKQSGDIFSTDIGIGLNEVQGGSSNGVQLTNNENSFSIGLLNTETQDTGGIVSVFDSGLNNNQPIGSTNEFSISNADTDLKIDQSVSDLSQTDGFGQFSNIGAGLDQINPQTASNGFDFGFNENSDSFSSNLGVGLDISQASSPGVKDTFGSISPIDDQLTNIQVGLDQTVVEDNGFNFNEQLNTNSDVGVNLFNEGSTTNFKSASDPTTQSGLFTLDSDPTFNPPSLSTIVAKNGKSIFGNLEIKERPLNREKSLSSAASVPNLSPININPDSKPASGRDSLATRFAIVRKNLGNGETRMMSATRGKFGRQLVIRRQNSHEHSKETLVIPPEKTHAANLRFRLQQMKQRNINGRNRFTERLRNNSEVKVKILDTKKSTGKSINEASSAQATQRFDQSSFGRDLPSISSNNADVLKLQNQIPSKNIDLDGPLLVTPEVEDFDSDLPSQIFTTILSGTRRQSQASTSEQNPVPISVNIPSDFNDQTAQRKSILTRLHKMREPKEDLLPTITKLQVDNTDQQFKDISIQIANLRENSNSPLEGVKHLTKQLNARIDLTSESDESDEIEKQVIILKPSVVYGSPRGQMNRQQIFQARMNSMVEDMLTEISSLDNQKEENRATPSVSGSQFRVNLKENQQRPKVIIQTGKQLPTVDLIKAKRLLQQNISPSSRNANPAVRKFLVEFSQRSDIVEMSRTQQAKQMLSELLKTMPSVVVEQIVPTSRVSRQRVKRKNNPRE